MQSTYENFLKLSRLYPDQNADLSEVTLKYQQTSDPISFCFVFCKLFPYMLRVTRRYYYVSDQDKSSFCVYELNKAMKNYSEAKSAKILTLFNKYLIHRFLNEYESMSYDKRKINQDLTSLTKVYRMECPASKSSLDDVELMETLHSIDLTTSELKYCEIVAKSTHKIKDAEIARAIGLTPPAIHHIKNRLQKKLDCAF